MNLIPRLKVNQPLIKRQFPSGNWPFPACFRPVSGLFPDVREQEKSDTFPPPFGGQETAKLGVFFHPPERVFPEVRNGPELPPKLGGVIPGVIPGGINPASSGPGTAPGSSRNYRQELPNLGGNSGGN